MCAVVALFGLALRVVRLRTVSQQNKKKNTGKEKGKVHKKFVSYMIYYISDYKASLNARALFEITPAANRYRFFFGHRTLVE